MSDNDEETKKGETLQESDDNSKKDSKKENKEKSKGKTREKETKKSDDEEMSDDDQKSQKKERHIELKGTDEEKIIVNLIEIKNKTGIYKFKIEESIDYNGESIAENVKEEIKPKDEDEENPEVILFRKKPKNYRDEEPKKKYN